MFFIPAFPHLSPLCPQFIVSAFFPRCLQFVRNSQHNYLHRSNHTRRGSRPFYYNELSGRSSSARSLSSSHHARSIQAPPPSTLHSITNCSYLSVYLPWYRRIIFYLIGMVGHIPLGHWHIHAKTLSAWERMYIGIGIVLRRPQLSLSLSVYISIISLFTSIEVFLARNAK